MVLAFICAWVNDSKKNSIPTLQIDFSFACSERQWKIAELKWMHCWDGEKWFSVLSGAAKCGNILSLIGDIGSY